jgi:Protein of unknown function (DUF4238)
VAYRKNHLASQFYLANWAGASGRLCVVAPPETRAEERRPENVGYRNSFWGADRPLRRTVERRLHQIETDAADVLRRLDELWPLKRGTEEWQALSMFLAINLWRHPFGQDRLRDAGHFVLADQEAAYNARFGRSEFERFVGVVSSDAYRADLFTRNLVRAGSLIGSMHWTWVEFSGRDLATSDVPLTVVPILRDDEVAPVAPLPAGSLLDTEELRFALSPEDALVMTWLDHQGEGLRVRGGDRIAAYLNRAVIRQADRQWFHHPERRPTTLVTPDLGETWCPPVGRLILPGYDSARARCSRRRAHTGQMMRAAIDSDRRDQMFWVRVADAA